jgi:hypothetical protein
MRYQLLKGDAPGATRMLSQIVSLLRASLDGAVVSEVSFSRELDFAKKYLAIEQTRLGDRLHVEFDIAHDSLGRARTQHAAAAFVETLCDTDVGQLRQGGGIALRTTVEKLKTAGCASGLTVLDLPA